VIDPIPTSQDFRQCSVSGCNNPADYDVYVDDDIPGWGKYLESDNYCPHICHQHAVDNESGAQGIRAHGSWISYSYTKMSTPGYTRYKSIVTGKFIPLKDFSYPALRKATKRRTK
jgi:hypothetical protein